MIFQRNFYLFPSIVFFPFDVRYVLLIPSLSFPSTDFSSFCFIPRSFFPFTRNAQKKLHIHKLYFLESHEV